MDLRRRGTGLFLRRGERSRARWYFVASFFFDGIAMVSKFAFHFFRQSCVVLL